MYNSEVIIDCERIFKSFGQDDFKIDVLKSIDLQIYKGEFFMLVGPSGCGKTTLISIIAGIMKFDSGRCIVDGSDLTSMRDEDLIKFRAKNIGFVFQGYNLIPSLTVSENVAIPLIINGMDRLAAIKKATDILASVGLSEKANNLPSLLSGGQQQRVAISRALVHNPQIIICDEPTSALDLHTGSKIIELLKSINKQLGTTFILVTHDSRILKYADRIVNLDDGKILNTRQKK